MSSGPHPAQSACWVAVCLLRPAQEARTPAFVLTEHSEQFLCSCELSCDLMQRVFQEHSPGQPCCEDQFFPNLDT